MILTFKGDYPNEPVVCTWAHFLAHLRFPMPTWLALLLVYSLEVLKFYYAYEFLGDLVKLQVLIGRGGWGFYISYKLPGGADAGFRSKSLEVHCRNKCHLMDL